MTSETILDRLEARASRATTGPWHMTKLPAGTGAAAFGRAVVNAEESGYPGAMLEGIRAETDAAYIAGADPETVLALVAIAQAAGGHGHEFGMNGCKICDALAALAALDVRNDI